MRGSAILSAKTHRDSIPMLELIKMLAKSKPVRVPGTAMFMAGNADAVPGALLRNFACNRILHERVVLLTVIIREVPWVDPSERLEVKTLAHGFYRVIVYFGFMDRPDVSQALELCQQRGFPLEPLQTWFLLSRATVISTPGKGMASWRERLFAAMARNARTAGDYFNLPAGQVIELGTKIEI